MTYVNLLKARCVTCERPFGFVDEFTSDAGGIRHVRCESPTFCPKCGEHRSEHDYACDDGFGDVTNGEGL